MTSTKIISGEVHGTATCNDCGAPVAMERAKRMSEVLIRLETSALPYIGKNYDEHLCPTCKKNRERDYDRYVTTGLEY